MKKFMLAFIALGLLLAACAPTPTPIPPATATQGPVAPPQPTPGRLNVYYVEAAVSPKEDRWQNIPLSDGGTESKSGLKLQIGSTTYWIHRSTDADFDSHHIHFEGGFISLYHSRVRGNDVEFKVSKGGEPVIVVRMEEGTVLYVGTVQGSGLYFRRIPGTNFFQVAIP